MESRTTRDGSSKKDFLSVRPFLFGPTQALYKKCII
jgi:hypothetical protein